ncbi:PREDICTED: EF-hand domain-containing protein D1-like [Crocodylus porosus]|uniref:EF-hand domain-containing protein D1-like n=1 Tax=Crocodylus porosus TaxID=8502 RepID=UPI00093A47C1|nr:PREDICTED: EF-hand domain-containing protein D1-like [Crocodylus porosus]
MASDELAQKLQRRLLLEEAGAELEINMVPNTVTIDIPLNYDRREYEGYISSSDQLSFWFFVVFFFLPFSPFRYDSGKDGYIDLMELKLMMEKLGAPQTHLGLKNMIKEVDEDFDGKLSFREFLLIFHKAAAGELEEDSGLLTLAKLSEIDVSTEGVKGAKNFFEAKVQALSSASKFEAEIKAEQDERKREEEERKHRRAAFKELKSAFTQ